MNSVIAETSYDCVATDGEEFVARLKIGDMELVDVPSGCRHARFRISFEPLFEERNVGGVDSFQALCLAIELVRDSLNAFRAHGGLIYFSGTKSPINLESSSFAPIREPISPRFLAGDRNDADRRRRIDERDQRGQGDQKETGKAPG